MKEVFLSFNKMLIVADKSGNILKAIWDSTVSSPDAPKHLGMALADDEEVHQVDVPEELYQANPPSLSEYTLRVSKDGPAVLSKRSAAK